MQKQVSLETAKKLAEAGIVLETDNYWAYACEKLTLVGWKDWHIWSRAYAIEGPGRFCTDKIPAPDIVELLEALPDVYKDYNLKVVKGNSPKQWEVYYFDEKCFFYKELVEALAECLLWVKKQEVEDL